MKKIIQNYDYMLLFNIFALFFIGILALASATNYDVNGFTNKLKVQIASFILGFIVMIIVSIIDYKKYANLYILIYFLGIIALLLVYVPGLGTVQFGARSWIRIKSINFQTSEIVKIIYVIVIAKVLDKYKEGLNSFTDLIPIFLISAPYFVLIYKQPDLGNMLVFLFIVIGMLFESKLSYKIILKSFILFLISLPILYFNLNDYQKNRINEFLNPTDLSNSAYFHRYMSEITIGSGKLFGSGLFQGGFSSNKYLPVQESDFIFAVWVENTGFVGGMVLIFLYFLFMSKLIYIAFNARDRIGTYITIGILFMFMYNIIENISMTIGLMPITGVTLPFISYGGSSILINMIAVGLVLNVSLRSKLNKNKEYLA